MSPERWKEPLYLALFIALVGGLWAVTLQQTREWVTAIQVMGNAVVIAVAVTITLREVIEMLAEAFKKKMRELGQEEGRREGIAEGLTKGRREERQEMLDRLVEDSLITEEQRRQIEAEREKG